MDSRSIYFAHVSETPASALRRLPSGSGIIQWIFLGEDYSQFLLWQEAMPANSKTLSFKRELDQAIEALSKPFSDVITRLGRVYNSPSWWSSRISEKNIRVSPLFLHCCYLSVLDGLIGQLQGNIVVIGEDYDLLRSAELLVCAHGCDVKRKKWLARYREYLIRAYKALGRIIKFLWRSFQLSLSGGSDVPKEHRDGIVLIHTFLDEACLVQEGKFKDIYFTGLSSWLKGKGYQTMTLPVLFNIRRSYRSVWQWLQRAEGYFLNPFKYYSIMDYVFVLRESFRQQAIIFKDVKLNGLDVTRLFRAEQRRKAFACLDPMLYYRLPLRLVQAGFRIERVIMVFENMINEKMLNLGFKKYSKETVSVGYQHSTLWPTLLCQFVSSEEALFAPLSDKIVCSGRLFYDILAQKGIPRQKLEIGPGLRYSYLSKKNAAQSNEQPKADILVTLPLMTSDATELLIKVFQAFEGRKHLKILIKPHPMINREWLLQITSKLNFPPHFSMVEGSMEEQLKQVRMVMGMSSGTLMEVYVAGKPVIVVGRNTSIDFNPLGFIPGFDNTCVTPEDIYNKTVEILNAEGKMPPKERFQNPVFSPVTDELMEAFLKK